ncbi:MurR/RpiR family transcriptional regulator [Hydrogenoanaerobacterium sp.]|uniref:MurR/RpiR family transcriptional regulator n=1 Tax=Hydrogenoanaerobacterium sp. TaxID=2953763 RepID=UPI00289AF318|nr:MurR/RpiR family transcriptional regulator [Hydrogenoanaerobacterium sp.]
MKSVLVLLKEYQNQASSAERTIIKFLLEKPQQSVSLSIHKLAEASFSSPSTVIRLCRKLGFDGYKEFRSAIIYELAVRQQSVTEERKEIGKSDSIEEIVDKITYKNIISLENTKNLTDMKTLKQCVKLICDCRNICLFGIGSSLVVARDAHLKFLRLNKPCFINDDWHSQLLQARNMSPQDVGIVISYSGQTVEMLECVRAMRVVGAPVIAITRYDSSPLAELADHNLYVAANESTFRSGAMSSRISQLNIVDILYTAFANSRYDYCLEQLSKTHILKPKSTRFVIETTENSKGVTSVAGSDQDDNRNQK